MNYTYNNYKYNDENRQDPNDSRITGYITYDQLISAYIFNDELVNQEHGLRPYQKNGKNQQRSINDIDAENLEGKIAEFAVYNALKDRDITCTYPSLGVFNRGTSDPGYDLTANDNITIDVKSSKSSAKAMFLPITKFTKDKFGHVKYTDSETNTIPDLYIMVNVGVQGLRGTASEYKKHFAPKIYNLCKNRTTFNGGKFVNGLNIYIEGLLPKIVLIHCIMQGIGYFRGISGYHDDDVPDAEYIPTIPKKWKLHYDNIVFPYPNVKLNNPNNKKRPYVHMMAPSKYL